jgi:hypothetical protein
MSAVSYSPGDATWRPPHLEVAALAFEKTGRLDWLVLGDLERALVRALMRAGTQADFELLLKSVGRVDTSHSDEDHLIAMHSAVEQLCEELAVHSRLVVREDDVRFGTGRPRAVAPFVPARQSWVLAVPYLRRFFRDELDKFRRDRSGELVLEPTVPVTAEEQNGDGQHWPPHVVKRADRRSRTGFAHLRTSPQMREASALKRRNGELVNQALNREELKELRAELAAHVFYSPPMSRQEPLPRDPAATSPHPQNVAFARRWRAERPELDEVERGIFLDADNRTTDREARRACSDRRAFRSRRIPLRA